MAYVHDIPLPFLKSCQQHPIYPRRLVDRSRYGVPLLEIFDKRFQARQRQLNLFSPDTIFSIPYWDVSKAGVVDQAILSSEQQLSQWIGDEFQQDPRSPTKVLAAKPDPQCRYIFLPSRSSVKPLELTQNALKRILSYHQVAPCLLDFLYCYGHADGTETESARFSGLRTEKTLRGSNPALNIPALNRSGRRYQMCYTLKGVDLKTADATGKAIIDKTWRTRPALIHHQFDIEKGTQLWIIGDPLQGIQNLITEHIHEKKSHAARYGTFAQSFKSSLDSHLLYAQWACEGWRWHVQSLEEIFDKITDAVVTPGTHPQGNINWMPEALVITQLREEYLLDSITALDSNVAILNRLGAFYKGLIQDPAWPQAELAAAQHCVSEFVSQLEEYTYDMGTHLKRARLTAQRSKDRKDILIQHLNTQNASKQEAYTHVMWEQQQKSGIDAVAMKVITVITLVYLPMTFVSTFFSTDVVKYQDSGSNDNDSTSASSQGSNSPAERVSNLALARFFEVSVPLMLLTFCLAYAWYKWEKRGINARERSFSEKYTV
ncbi:hypothetical protein B0H63DRAFT_2043 [Podospora didyma]|uniref:CorA-like transporter domain-containing protein n=1 Tax=Podospora didyma TaxID=330526 RepID=A0AAE0P3V2_9PEZI|nr:hypothetical protein B0H63DRAFT_2043 [Podospora didyma]